MGFIDNGKNKFIDKMMTIIVLLEIFVNEDILLFGTSGISVLINLKYLSQIMCFFVFLFKKKVVKKTDAYYSLLFLMGLVLLSCFINFDIRPGYFFMIMVYSSAFLCLQNIHIDSIFEIFYKAMVVICLVSLVFFTLRAINSSTLSFFPIITNVANVDFYFCGLTNVVVSTGGFLRNYGPFREPGVFQMFIIVVLIYAFFKRNELNVREVLILILALITTFSTTGYIALIFLVMAFILNRNVKSKKLKWITIIILFCVAGYLALGTDYLYKESYGSVFGKFSGAYTGTSMGARTASIYANVKMFFLNPVVGCGITYVEESFSKLAFELVGVVTKHNTNTIFIQLARFGLFFELLFVYRYVKFIWKYVNSGILSKMLVVCSFFVLFFGEDLTYSFVFSLFLFVPTRSITDNISVINWD